MDELLAILEETGIPFSYHHFAEGEFPEPPFICYLLPEDDDFAADGINYYEIDVVQMELYTDKKDLELEHRVQQILTNHGIYYERNEVWIVSFGRQSVILQLRLLLEMRP